MKMTIFIVLFCCVYVISRSEMVKLDRDNDRDEYGTASHFNLSLYRWSLKNEDYDDANAAIWYGDSDGDGFGDPAVTMSASTKPPGYVANAMDGCPTIFGWTAWTDCDQYFKFYRDNDQDGHGSSSFVWGELPEETVTATVEGVSVPFNNLTPYRYSLSSDDCDDTNAAIWSANTVWYRDTDGDGFGDPAVTTRACTKPVGYVANATDGCPAIFGWTAWTDCSRYFKFYRDNDQDGHGSSSFVWGELPEETVTATVEGVSVPFNNLTPYRYSLSSDDCDDTNAAIWNANTVWYHDADGDGFGDPAVTTHACTKPVGYVANAMDGCPTIFGWTAWTDCDRYFKFYRDNDQDGHGSSSFVWGELPEETVTATVEGVSVPFNNLTPYRYSLSSDDCDDTNAAIWNANTVWYGDSDGDGFGDPAVTMRACTKPAGYVANATDGCPAIFGWTAWADCDRYFKFYRDNDQDGHGSSSFVWGELPEETVTATVEGVSVPFNNLTPYRYSLSSDDCDDANPSFWNGDAVWYADNDGDGLGDAAVSIRTCIPPPGYVTNADDGCPTIYGWTPGIPCYSYQKVYRDNDNDGYGLTTDFTWVEYIEEAIILRGTVIPFPIEDIIGWTFNDGECDDTDPAIPQKWYMDQDGDGFGKTDRMVLACSRPAGYVLVPNDCNDQDSNSGGGCLTAQLSNANYIYTITPTVESTQLLASTSALKEITYYDELGREDQQTQVGQGAKGEDIIKFFYYDRSGRKERDYLPYPESGSFGSKRTDLQQSGTRYYNKKFGDANSFSMTVFEKSPLSRIMKQGSVGADWQPDAVNGYQSTDHTIRKAYEFNSTGEVLLWTYAYPTPAYPLGLVNAGTTLATAAYYPINKLQKNKSKDEQGNETIEYKDKEGRLVLKRVKIVAGTVAVNDTNYASTYYVYDDFGKVVCIIPPEAAKAVTASPSGYLGKSDAQKEAFLKQWAFRFTFDARRRMTRKQAPGIDPVYIVYDSRNRKVLIQDGNQRAKKGTGNIALPQWSFTKYDEQNRPVLTGIKDTTVVLTQEAMQGVIDQFYEKTWTRLGEMFVGNTANNIHGYTNRAYPVVTTGGVADPDSYLTVAYYDNYNFKSLLGSSAFDYHNQELPEDNIHHLSAQPVSAFPFVAGQATGSKVRMLSEATWLQSVTYYDDKYRVIQSITDNPRGYQVNTSTYDFIGQKTRTRESLYKGQPVGWTNLVNVQVNGTDLIALTAPAWGAGASSIQVLPANTDGWVEVYVTQCSPAWMFGLSDIDVNASYTTIDYAAYINASALGARENGVSKYSSASVFPGDVIRVERVGRKIHFKRNGIIYYTSVTPSTTSLMVDVSMNAGAGIGEVRLSNNFNTITAPVPDSYVTKRFTYDHAGSLVDTWHQLDNAPAILLRHNEYNELHQVIDKKLHSTAAYAADSRQSIDYRYNIRGWLTSINNAELEINDTNDDPEDLLGMNFAYNTDLGTGNANDDPALDLRQYNGSISAFKWSNTLGEGDAKTYAYNIKYDGMGRLLAGTHLQSSTSGVWTAGLFDENNMSYDLNGNIKFLQRKGKNGTLIDDLEYAYGTGTTASNKLLSVTDRVTLAGDKEQGFYDGNIGTADYTYDLNGNLLTDKNKGITAGIEYNHMNLVANVTRSTASIRYHYDASGRKWGETVVNGRIHKQTEYIGSWVIANNQIEFLQHDEGRVVLTRRENVFLNDGDASLVTPSSNVTSVSEEVDGKTYLKVTGATGTSLSRTGIIFNTVISVTPGERYMFRIHGYSDAQAACLYVSGNSGDLIGIGPALLRDKANESWIEAPVIIPTGVSEINLGVLWNSTATTGGIFNIDQVELYRITPNTPEYQYHLKDHLGNVRLTFTTREDQEAFTATLEEENADDESPKFIHYNEAVKVNASLFDHTNAGTTYYATRLNGTAQERYGLAKSLSVMPGDKVRMEVFVKYIDADPAQWTTALNSFMTQIANVPASTIVDGGVSGSIGAGVFPFAALLSKDNLTGEAPKAFLNYIAFNRDMKPILADASQTNFIQVSEAAKENGQDGAHERLFAEVTVKEAGYMYIYLSNDQAAQGESPVEVYFDDFTVEHIKSPIVQANDYYPFGLTYNEYQRENSVGNRWKFQGQEHIDDLGLGWDSFKWRNHQPDLGRFFNVDPLADKYPYYSPYVFSGNEVTSAIELEGLEPLKLRSGVQTLIIVNQGFAGNPDEGSTQAQRAGVKDEDLGKMSYLDRGSIQVGVYTSSRSDDTNDDMASTIMSFKKSNPDGKVITIGHSLGADNLVEMAQENSGVSIDKMILLDLFELIPSTTIPSNVKDVTNFHQSNSFPSGYTVKADDPNATMVENIPIQGSTHKTIDDNLANSIISMITTLIESYNK